jgi:hypothetical protein
MAALSGLGRIEDGRAAMRRVIELEPTFTVAGFVAAQTGRPEIWDPIGRALANVCRSRSMFPSESAAGQRGIDERAASL